MDDLTSQGCGNGIEFIKFEDYWRQGFLAREANISRLKSDLQISIYYQVCGNFYCLSKPVWYRLTGNPYL